MKRRWMVAVWLGLLAACDNRGGIGTTGGMGGGGGSGGNNGGCAPSQRVDGFGNCLDVCLDEADCGEHAWCHEQTGLCLPDDTGTCDPAACAPGFVCPPGGEGPCEPSVGYCESTWDCPFGQRCDANRCISADNDLVQTCTVDAECELGMSCRYGVCTGCFTDVQCLAWNDQATCVMGACVVTGGDTPGGCLTTRCGEGYRCNPVSGICELACTVDADCDPGETCAPVLNQCVTDSGCSEDEDCLGDQTCTTGLGFEEGICTGCSASDPCKDGLGCVLGVCLPDLGGDPCAGVECEARYACDPLDGTCYPSDGGCDSDADCRPGHTCSSLIGLCSGCTADGDCRPGQRCIFSTCAPVGGYL